MGQKLARNYSIGIPEILPGPGPFPQEDLAFDQPTVSVDGGDGGHILVGQRLSGGALQIAKVLFPFYREGNGYLSPLYRPFDTNKGRVYI